MNWQAAFSRRRNTTMCTKAMIGLAAASVFVAAATVPASGASSKFRAARSAPSQIPAPAYGFRKDGRAHSSNPAHDVYVNGTYISSDPDPLIRAELHRNPPSVSK
jgi:hypothetical protein